MSWRPRMAGASHQEPTAGAVAGRGVALQRKTVLPRRIKHFISTRRPSNVLGLDHFSLLAKERNQRKRHVILPTDLPKPGA